MNFQRMPNIFMIDSQGKTVTKNGQPVVNRGWFLWLEAQMKSTITVDESSTPLELAMSFPQKAERQHEMPIGLDATRKPEAPIPMFPVERRRMNEVELTSIGIVYCGDRNAEGTWRARRSGTDFVFERLESGTWVVKQTIAA